MSLRPVPLAYDLIAQLHAKGPIVIETLVIAACQEAGGPYVCGFPNCDCQSSDKLAPGCTFPSCDCARNPNANTARCEHAKPTPTGFVAVGRHCTNGDEVRVPCTTRANAQMILNTWDHRKIFPLRIEEIAMTGIADHPTEEQHLARVLARSMALSETALAYGHQLRELTKLENYVEKFTANIGDPSVTWTHASHPEGARETMSLVTAELRKPDRLRTLIDAAVKVKQGEVRILRARLTKLMMETRE